MTLFKDSLRWSLPLFWSGIAFAAFFTFAVVGADAGGSAPSRSCPSLGGGDPRGHHGLAQYVVACRCYFAEGFGFRFAFGRVQR